MEYREAVDSILQVGRALFEEKIVAYHQGNVSIRLSDSEILITRHGAPLGFLAESDIVKVEIETGEVDQKSGSTDPSAELPVHLGHYRRNPAGGIIHAHPLMGTILSLHRERIELIDLEGQYYLGVVPVIQATLETVLTEDNRNQTIEALQEYPLVMVQGHGCFASGTDLHDACKFVASFEHGAKILYYANLEYHERRD
jgi:L-fuculose-phosphate aldolase